MIREIWNETSAWIKILSISILALCLSIGIYWLQKPSVPKSVPKSFYTQNYEKAIEQLKHKNIKIRKNALYELGKIARKSKDYHLQIVKLLCRYIRREATQAQFKAQGNMDSARDIHVALDVLGRRSAEWIEKIERPQSFRMNLNGIYIKRAHLLKPRFDGAKLAGAYLENAHLERANLDDADLSSAHLERTYLWRTRFQDADLTSTYLQGAQLWRARFQGANLTRARFDRANLTMAQLQGADLTEAHLTRANLTGSDLEGVRNLTQAQIDSAFGDMATKIPPSLTRPEHWIDRELDKVEAITEWVKWKDDPEKYQPPPKEQTPN